MFDFPASPSVGQIISGPGGSPYKWDGTKWTPSAFVQQPLGTNVSRGARNYVHNPIFRWWQRGAGPITTSGSFIADRWFQGFVNDTMSTQQGTFADPGRAVIGDERAQWQFVTTVTGSATAGSYSHVGTRMENLWRFSNKTVILSFWANNAGTAINQIAVNLSNYFGTGGSPTAQFWLTAQIIPLASGQWQRVFAIFNVPSISGKTLGTANDSNLGIAIITSGSSAGFAGSLTPQSGSLYLWGVQLEIAQPGQTQPSPLDRYDERVDFDNCRRFYQTGNFQVLGYQGTAGNGMGYAHTLTPPMRAVPTMGTSGTPTTTNCTGTLGNVTANSFVPYATSIAAGEINYRGTFTASADI